MRSGSQSMHLKSSCDLAVVEGSAGSGCSLDSYKERTRARRGTLQGWFKKCDGNLEACDESGMRSKSVARAHSASSPSSPSNPLVMWAGLVFEALGLNAFVHYVYVVY
jgi:hypothetical protein